MEKLQTLLESLTAAEGVPSGIIGLRRGGKLTVFAAGYADRERKLVPNEDTIYAIGSCSKAFIAAAVCMLQEEGKLDLNSPVKRYLPDFRLYTQALTDGLTLRDMLSHSSGLSTHDLLYESVLDDLDIRELVRRMRYMPPKMPFRYGMNYQNHMFALASLLVEEVSGMPWQVFLKTRIFDPLGMSRTFCDLEDFMGEDNYAKPYSRDPDGGVTESFFDPVFRAVAAAGCINSTVHDMDQWLRLQLGRGELEGLRVFSPESAELLFSPQTIIRRGEFFPFSFDEIGAVSYGLGWCLQYFYGHKMVAHGGSINGFRALAAFLPADGVCFSILCNLEGTSLHELMAYQIAAELLGHGGVNWVEKITAAVAPPMRARQEAEARFWAALDANAKPPLPLDRYCGRYRSELYGTMELSVRNGTLSAVLGTMTLELFYAGGEKFAARRPGKDRRYEIDFKREGDRPTGFTWNPDTPVFFEALP
jgi:CubicO group peptidase (beta-lactamase class C family)